jgi:hypothetical protein
MLQALADWIFGRALRLSAASVTALAKRTRQSPERIRAVNDAVAGIAAHEAVAAAARAVGGAQNE